MLRRLYKDPPWLRRRVQTVAAVARRLDEPNLNQMLVDPRRDEAVRDLTTRVNDRLSEAIRRNPTQWPWWHQRWRRGPRAPLDPEAPIE